MRYPGFTLIESLVVVAITGILIVLGVGIFLSNNRFYANQSGKIQLVNAARESGDKINEFARHAVAVLATHNYASQVYTTDSDTVVFQVPALDNDDEVIPDTFDYVIVSRNAIESDHLELIVDSDSASVRKSRVLLWTDKLTGLNFTYDNSDLALVKNISYQINLTDTGRFPASETIYGSATLRN